MLPPPPRRSSNVAVMLVVGFIVATVAEFAIDLLLSYTVTLRSATQANVITIVLSLLLGAISGGAMFLARPRHPAVGLLAGVSSVVAGVIADEAATIVYFALHHLSVDADLITGYFTHARTVFWVGMVLQVVLAETLTLVRVQTLQLAERRAQTQPWSPPGQPWQQGPYGPPPYGPPQGDRPPPYGPPGPDVR